MENNNLENKVVVITGALGQLGKEFSHACATNGAKVVMADINDTGMQEFLDKYQDNVIFAKCDVTKEGDIDELMQIAVTKFGKIDALVNSAYPRNNNYGKKFEDVSYDDFCQNVSMHMGGCFLASQKAAQIMKKQGHGNIINIGSIYGFCAPRFEIYNNTKMTMPVEYSFIKGGILNFTKYLASYLGEYNIRVNAISPGGVFNNQPQEFVDAYCQHVLLEKRMADPKDISGVLKFLLSDESKYITGQNIVVDGGWSIS